MRRIREQALNQGFMAMLPREEKGVEDTPKYIEKYSNDISFKLFRFQFSISIKLEEV